MLRTCWLVTLDRDVAADIAQESMLRAWQHWERIRQENPAAWVTTVALNLGRSRWRRLKREARPVQRTASGTDGPMVVDPVLLGALRSLPLRQREALILHYWGDFSVAECASAMGVSPGSVKQHLRRARLSLAGEPALRELQELTP